jgi:hypothetical protein
MWQYYHDIGDSAKALEVTQRALAKSGGPIALLSALSLYREAKFAETLRCLNERRQADLIGDVTRAFVLAELPDGGRLALDNWHKLTRRYTHEVWELRYPCYLLLFLGRKEQAQANLRKFRLPFAQAPDWRDFFAAMHRFGCGELSEAGYLAKAASSRWKQAFAHFEIGLSRLADGDRALARDHFSKAVDTRAIWLFQWSWALMFLSRLEQRPSVAALGPGEANRVPGEVKLVPEG